MRVNVPLPPSWNHRLLDSLENLREIFTKKPKTDANMAYIVGGLANAIHLIRLRIDDAFEITDDGYEYVSRLVNL